MTINRTTLAALAAIATVAGGLAPVPADAAVVIDIAQVGNDVVATGSGSINLSGSSSYGPGSINSLIWSIANTVLVGNGDSSFYTTTSLPSASMGEGELTKATSSSGDFFGIFAISGVFGVPRNYLSGNALNGTSTYANQTLASLGLNVGSYVFETASDSFTVNVGVTPTVPEPATWAMMLVGFGMVAGAARYRRKARTVSFA